MKVLPYLEVDPVNSILNVENNRYHFSRISKFRKILLLQTSCLLPFRFDSMQLAKPPP